MGKQYPGNGRIEGRRHGCTGAAAQKRLDLATIEIELAGDVAGESGTHVDGRSLPARAGPGAEAGNGHQACEDRVLDGEPHIVGALARMGGAKHMPPGIDHILNAAHAVGPTTV